MEFENRKISVVKTEQGVYILVPPSPQDFFNPERALFILIILVSVIFIPLYVILRLLLNPLKVLSNTVQQIGRGNYDVDVPFKRKDELGELGDSIKTMAGNIKHSIKTKEQLLIDVSHELRSPLTRLNLGIEVDSPKEKIKEDIREMENMITGLLESYKAESNHNQLKTERTNLVELCDEIKDEYELDNRLIFEHLKNNEIRVNVDPSKIKIVLRNLIDNAMKYSSGDVRMQISEKNRSVVITISDKGIGIPSKDLEYIFEPFYRSDPSRSRRTGGFGLGLSISKKIIEAHNGTINVMSKENEGSEFSLTLVKAE
jgi:signal transduction histidine kinase